MDYQAIAARLIEGDKTNQLMFSEMDAMFNMEWKLPGALSGVEGIRKEVTSDPHDSVRAGTRVLASVRPNISISPTHDNPETKQETDKLERFIGWHLQNANRRRGNNIADIVQHAILYARSAAQVVYLESQDSAMGFFGDDKRRKKAAERYGPFAIIVRDPRNVFPEYSDWGLERVVHRSIMRTHEVIDFWGDHAKKIKKELGKDESLQYCTVFDYQDYDRRHIWCVLQGKNTKYAEPGQGGIVLLDEPTKTDFLPWVVKDTGKQLVPMLYSIYKTGQWDSQNIYETITSTDIIRYAAAARDLVRSPDPEGVTTSEVDGRVELSPDEEYERLEPYGIDDKLVFAADRLHNRMARSTIPDIVQSGTVPPGVDAFSAINLMQESGLKALTPYKTLAEDVLAGVVHLMFEWMDHEGETLTAYPTQSNGLGEVIRVGRNDFDPARLYVKVELTPDVPTDRMARINAAVMMVERLHVSLRHALEAVGITDPGAEMDQHYIERKREDDYMTAVEIERNRAATMVELEAQQVAEQMAAQQQQPPQQLGQEPAQPNGQIPSLQQGGGLGFNPALGGQPPAPLDPSRNRITQVTDGTQIGGQ
jgi:hypothetical protein